MSVVDLKGARKDFGDGADRLGPGRHEVTIADVKDYYKVSGDGDDCEAVKVLFKSDGGQLWDNFWTNHPNPQAVSIGKSRLAWLADTAGETGDELETESLRGKRLLITVERQKGSNYMRVKRFDRLAGGRPPAEDTEEMEDILW